jgi:hypothetical protein
MKSLSVRLGVILVIGIVIFGCAGMQAADWRLFAETQADIGMIYYDAANITHPSKDIVRTWVRLVYSKDGVALQVKELGKRYEDLSYTLSLLEVNCAAKKNRVLQSTSYSRDGNVISSNQSQQTEWSLIIPGSIGETLHKTVCK